LPQADAPASTAPGVTIPVIEGLDTASGLKRLMGNKALYMKLLRQYVDGQSRAAVSIRDSLAAGDRKTAERIAHTARGVSGNIGALAVQHAAERVERAIGSGSEDEAMIAELESALDLMVGRIAAAVGVPEAEAPGSAPSIDPDKIKPLLVRLAGLLEVSDGEVLEVVSEEEPAVRSVLGSDFAALEKAVNSFDFEVALERLRKSADRHNITL
jgi:HPt (histidine-containing phosphotransfer) domain-containing protein